MAPKMCHTAYFQPPCEKSLVHYFALFMDDELYKLLPTELAPRDLSGIFAVSFRLYHLNTNCKPGFHPIY